MREMQRCDIASNVATLGDGPPADHRRAPRYTLLIRTAKLICPRGEFLCVVRDASETGISARIFHALPHANEDAATMVLELPNGDRHEIQQIWEKQDLAGFRFDEPANITRLVESPSTFSKRAVRINLAANYKIKAAIQAGSDAHDAQLTNISQQGAQVLCGTYLSIDQRVQLKCGSMPEVSAKIRWRHNGNYGLIFENTFQFGDLARIVATLQTGGQTVGHTNE